MDILIPLGLTALIAVFTALAVRGFRAQRKQPPHIRNRYCTKHRVGVSPWGGPDRMYWVYGTHRTPGNACDGPEHRRMTRII